MAPKLITMLTYNDETVDDALSIFRDIITLLDKWRPRNLKIQLYTKSSTIK